MSKVRTCYTSIDTRRVYWSLPYSSYQYIYIAQRILEQGNNSERSLKDRTLRDLRDKIIDYRSSAVSDTEKNIQHFMTCQFHCSTLHWLLGNNIFVLSPLEMLIIQSHRQNIKPSVQTCANPFSMSVMSKIRAQPILSSFLYFRSLFSPFSLFFTLEIYKLLFSFSFDNYEIAVCVCF